MVLKANEYTFGGTSSAISVSAFLPGWINYFKSRSLFDGPSFSGVAKRKSRKLFLFIKMTEKHGNEHTHLKSLSLSMDGWMACDFTSFSTVFQSYQDDGRLIMKGCVQ